MNASLSYSRAVIYCSELSGIITVIVLFLIIKTGKWLWWIGVLVAILPKVLSSGTCSSRRMQSTPVPVGFAPGWGSLVGWFWCCCSDCWALLPSSWVHLLLLRSVIKDSCPAFSPPLFCCGRHVVGWNGPPAQIQGRTRLAYITQIIILCWLWWFIPGRVCDIIESNHCGARMRTKMLQQIRWI